MGEPPTTEQTLAKLAGAKIFYKLDANLRFWQRKLSVNSKLLTTFITTWERYCYRRLPFGISSAPENFQKIMQKILAGLEGVECQTDDVLVFGDAHEQHDQRLEAVSKNIEDNGITLNIEKCEFAMKEIQFLGHHISKDRNRSGSLEGRGNNADGGNDKYFGIASIPRNG